VKHDIQSGNDIKQLVDRFYEKVKTDDLIGYIFTDVYQVNWDKHLPVMYRFWENAVFYNGAYQGNPLSVHQAMHTTTGLSREQFDRWLDLFISTADELFFGERTTLAKQRATNMTAVMREKLFGEGDY
jgi:hemoglobin